MMVVGLPGLLLAIIMVLTVPEPQRGVQDGAAQRMAAPATLLQSLRRCAQIRTLYPFVIGLTCLNIGYSGWTIWMPAFLMRVHHLSATSMGAVLGVVVALSAVAALIGGPISDRLAKRGARWRLYYCGAGAALAAPLLAASTLAPGLSGAVAFQLAFVVMAGGINTVATAAYLSVAPAAMRAVVTAVMNIIAAGLGGGLAPILFGFVNDNLKHSYGGQSLRYTLLISPLMMALTCVMFLIASRFIDRDVKTVQQPA
jgi:MFS family permease